MYVTRCFAEKALQDDDLGSSLREQYMARETSLVA